MRVPVHTFGLARIPPPKLTQLPLETQRPKPTLTGVRKFLFVGHDFDGQKLDTAADLGMI